MKRTLLIPLLFLSFLIYLKTYGVSSSDSNDLLNFQTLTPPHFPGGEKAFGKFLFKNLKWPKTAPDDYQGIVIIGFFVEKDGHLTGIKVKKSMAPDFDAEALRVVKVSPNYTCDAK